MMARLGDYIEQIRGVSYKPADLRKFGDENSVPLLRANNIQGGNLLLEDVIHVSKNKVSEKQYLKKGDILVCTFSGSKELVGKAAYIDQNVSMTFGAFCKIVRPKTECQKYIGYFFQSPCYRRNISNLSAGANINNIKNEHIDELETPFPSLAEQRKIVATLDKASDLAAKCRRQLEKLDKLVKSRFVELFGDPERNLMGWEKQSLSTIITNANNGIARRGNDPEGSVVIRLVELQNGYIDYSAPNRIFLTDAEKRRYLLYDKDFLFARVNGNPENVGRCAVFQEVGEPTYYNDHIIRVHFDNALLNGTFASVLLNSEYGKHQMRGQIKTSAGQYTISQDGIGAIITVLPPLKLQEQFAAFVEQTGKTKSAIQKNLQTLETLKKALMQKYFGGACKVNSSQTSDS